MKRRPILFPYLMLGAFALGGCTTAGNEALRDQNAATLHEQITVGKTTQDEVAAALGRPNTVLDQDSGGTIWIYRYSRARPWASDFIPLARTVFGRQDLESKELVVNFDPSKIVTKYSLREVTDLVKHGMFE